MKEETLQKLMYDISEWSDATFGNGQRNPAIAHHLKKEVEELITELSQPKSDIDKTTMEFADCFMLLLDSAHHYGLSAKDLIELAYKKLEINKARKWGKPDKNGVVEHIKDTP
jgi:NTP pyrophosphatase (non-canonical NTP hydrolase)